MKLLFLFILCLFCGATAIAQTAAESIARGNRYYGTEKYDLAENEYRSAMEADPKNTTARYNLANALQKQKKYSEAVKVLDQLGGMVTEKPFRSAVYYNQGVAHTRQKNLEESIESYKDALRLNPDDKDARENLQKALQEQKQKQQQNQQKKQDQKMSQKEAEQKLKLLQQKEKNLQQRLKDKNKQQGSGGQQDW